MNKANTKAVQVTEIKSRPDQMASFSMIMRGIRTKEAAEAWGAKYGFSQVYWFKKEEKVFGVKTIADDAQLLKEKSAAVLGQLEMSL